MKKSLLMLMTCIGLGTSASYAITVDELDGKIGGVIYKANLAQGILSHATESALSTQDYRIQNFRHYGVKFEKISDDRVKIIGLWDGFDVCATLDSNGSLTLDKITDGKNHMSGNTLSVSLTGWSGWTVDDWVARTADDWRDGYTIGFDGFMHWYPLIDGDVKSQSYTKLSSLKNVGVFNFTDNEVAYRIPNLGAAGNYAFAGMQLFVFESNATAYQLDKDNNIIDSFGMRLTPDASNTSLEILNWNNLGLNYQNRVNNKSNSYIGTITEGPTYNQIACSISGNDLSIPYQKEAGMIGGISKDYDEFYCHKLFDITADSYQRGYGEGIWYQENTELWNANSFISGGTDQSNITGTITSDLAHVFDHVKWTEKDGGRLKTYDKPVYVFGSSKVMYLSGTRFLEILYSNEVDKTIVIPDNATEITHSATFQIGPNPEDYEYSKYKNAEGELFKSFSLNGTITDRVNNDYIESYDLYAIPQAVSTVDKWASTDHHQTKGHTQGICIASGIKPELSRSVDGDIPVNVKLSGDEVPELSSGDNTFYLKANYTKESGLEPTFHSLISKAVVSGLDNIYDDVKGKVVVNGTTVTLSNTADKGMIATTTGTVVYQGGDATVDLAPGIYVVRAGSYVGKIIIR